MDTCGINQKEGENQRMKKYGIIVFVWLLAAWAQVSLAQTVAPQEVMTQNEQGYWVAHRQIPLVGEGRVVDNFMNDLVSVLDFGDTNLDCLVDTNLDNYAQFSNSVAGVDLFAQEIVSVRDLNRVYAAGQKVGVVIEGGDKAGILELDVLKGYVITTYLKGQLMETKYAVDESGLLSAKILSFTDEEGKSRASFSVMTDKPFDEIAITNTKLAGVDVLNSSLNIYYFYVGENPEIKAIKGEPFFETNVPTVHDDFWGNWTLGWYNDVDNLVNEDPEDYVWYRGLLGTGISVAYYQKATVNFNRDIPKGYEVGFRVYQHSGVRIGVLSGSGLYTYDQDDNKLDEMENRDVLGVDLISGGSQNISLVTTKPCRQVKIDFNGISIGVESELRAYYAYVREPVSVGPDAYLSLAPDTIFDGNGYQFYIPTLPAGAKLVFKTVSSMTGSANFSVDNDGTVTGMDVDGDYTVKATLTMPDEKVYTQQATITRITEASSNCNTLITNDIADIGTVKEGYGCLICIGGDDGENAEHIIDGHEDTYATVDLPLQVGFVEVTPVVAVTLKGEKTINAEKKQVRVGFTVQYTSQFLSLNALKFFYIRLYNDGEKVEEGVPGENNTVSLDLINGASDKVRVSIVTEKEFDHIELWYAGVLGVSLGTQYRIYNAFYEPDTDECRSYDPSEICMEKINWRSGASIWYEKTGFTGIGGGDVSLANVIGLIRNMGNLLDSDPGNTMEIVKVAEVAGGVSVGIKFREPITVPAGGKRQFGFIYKRPTGVADVDLLSSMQVNVYNKELIALTQESMGFEFLNLNLIGYGDKVHLEATVDATHSSRDIQVGGVEFIYSGLVDALTNFQVYGTYTRLDANGNDIPDCIEKPTNPPLEVTTNLAHYCGIKEEETQKVTFTVTGDDNISSLYCEVYAYDREAPTGYGKKEEYSNEHKLDQKKTFTLDLPRGDYYFRFKRNEADTEYTGGVLSVAIHPDETTWNPHDGSTNWNDWGNWTNGTPWECTNVIIPTDRPQPEQSSLSTDPEPLDAYPVLTDVENGNYCNYIHFEPHTEVVNTHKLKYKKAWVELALEPNRYYLLSMPLKGMVSGDMFIPEDQQYPSRFTDLTYDESKRQGTLPEDRVTPTIYQRLWEMTIWDRPLNGDRDLISPAALSWTRPYNFLGVTYRLDEASDPKGFSLWVDPGKPSDTEASSATSSYTFRFPKEHELYHYYDEEGNIRDGKTEAVVREPEEMGRFIYEKNDPTSGELLPPFPLTVTLTNRYYASTEFLMGNPFMAHVDLRAFMEENTHIASLRVYKDDNYVALTRDESGQLISADPSVSLLMEPMRSLFVVKDAEAGGNTCEVRFTEAMLTAGYGNSATTLQTRSSSNETDESGLIRLAAETPDGKRAYAAIRLSAVVSDDYQDREDAELLIDDEVRPAVALFTVADGKALEIEQRVSDTAIPLGFYITQPVDELKVMVSLPAGMSDHYWVDKEKGTSYVLRGGETTTLVLPRVESNVGRFSLQKNADNPLADGAIYAYYEQTSGQLVVRARSGEMSRCEVYHSDGRRVAMRTDRSPEYRMSVPDGILIIRVLDTDGDEITLKIVCF